jgi:hypothetical protein
LIYQRTTVCERGLSLEFLEHDCTSIQGPVGLTQRLKATVIFWTRAFHDSDAYRDPRRGDRMKRRDFITLLGM